MRRGQQHATHFLAGGLVIRAQHRTTRTWRDRGNLWITGDHQCLGDECADTSRLPGTRNVETLERVMIAHGVWCFTMRHLPDNLTLVEIDGRYGAIGWLEQRQALHGKPTAATGARGLRRETLHIVHVRGASDRNDQSQRRRRCVRCGHVERVRFRIIRSAWPVGTTIRGTR